MKWRNSIVSVVLVLVVSTATVFAEGDLGFEFTSDFNGKYIWRGQNLDDDPVFQPGLSASYKGLTAAIWGNLELTNINGNSGDFSELDYSIDYSSNLPDAEDVGFSIGAIYYDFPGTTVPSTTELYWGFSLDTTLSPSITFYHDIDEADGLYISAGIGHSIEKIFEIGPESPVAMELGASYGWGDSSYNKYYWGLNDSKANDLTLSASFPFEVGGWTVNPSINYVALVSSGIRKTDAYGTDDDLFFVGIGLSKGF
jgi:hypothetical protein